jgi:hypothetical protein
MWDWRRVRRFVEGVSGRAHSNMSSIISDPVYPSPEQILRNANALFRAEQRIDLQGIIAARVADLRHYDVLTMERVVAITFWGRSGSILLASYLDGHEDVMMLPANRSDGIYRFYELYQSLPLHDKLIAYPAFTEIYDAASEGAGCGRSFFAGDFAISAAQYYAATQAICEVYGKWSPEFLMSRRAFFLFVHIAYNLALGRRLASSRPLIVCAQHEWNDVRARHFVADFPHAKFIHTIRDPISAFDRLFDWWFDPELLPAEPLRAERAADTHVLQPARYISVVASWTVVRALVDADRPHSGMESRTRAIRFEDLHCDTAKTMRDLSEWLGLPYQATLLASTFNGIPYVVTRDGNSWSGPRPESVQRHLRNTSLKDQALLFALFYEDFVAWNYPCPQIFRNPLIRCLVLLLFPLSPMKTEIIAARAAFKRRVLPSLRHGNAAIAMHSFVRILFCRLGITWLLVHEGSRRLVHRKTLLQINHTQLGTESTR